MSTQEDQQNKQSEAEFKHIAKTLANDLRTLKAELDKEREMRNKAEARERERQEYLDKLESSVNQVKEEKKVQYGRILDEDVMPYLDKLKKESASSDPKLNTAIEQMEGTLKTGLDNAFMDESENNTLRLVSAIASADKHRSSDLERLLRTEQEWGQKYEDLMKQKTEIEAANELKAKELEESATLKEKMVEDLKKELEELKATAEKTKSNINNTEAHFEKDSKLEDNATESPVTLTQTPVVQATASGNKRSNGIDSLFDFRPRADWYSTIPDPGRGRQVDK